MEGKIIKKADINSEDKIEIKKLLKEYGNGSLAYSCLQDCVDYFFIPGKGFIGFSEVNPINIDNPEEEPVIQFRKSLEALLRQNNYNLEESNSKKTIHVLADPICDKSESKNLLNTFLEFHPDACFWHTTFETSSLLEQVGFSTNHFGFETVVELKDYEIKGNKKQNLKATRNKAKTLEYELLEIFHNDRDYKRMREISEEWIRGKISNRYELNFLARPMVPEEGEDVRIFGGYKDKKLEGYVIFSPIYENGKAMGYLKDIIRTSNQAFEQFESRSLSNALTIKAIEAFKDQDVKILSLAQSPFYGVESGGNPATTLMFSAIYQSANELYGFKRLADSKEIYRAQKNKIYFNSKENIPLDQVVDLFRLCKVF
ncbi:MAG: DUF2156 domain-containing protein [Victivallales bacterium]|jgi:phosphatidylglycerol lysyltransferase